MIKEFVSQSGTAIFAQVGVVLFFLLFLGIVYWTYRGRKNRYEHERNLPLEDGTQGHETTTTNNR